MIYKVKFYTDFFGKVYNAAGIVVQNNEIKTVDSFDKVFKNFKNEEVKEYEDYVAVPPLVNAHVHLELTDIEKKALDFSNHIDWVISLINEKRIKDKNFFINSFKNGLEQLKKYHTPFYGNILTPDIMDIFEKEYNFAEIISFNENLPREISIQISNFHKVSPHTFFTVHPLLMEKLFALKVPLSIHVFESEYEIDYLYDFKGYILDKLFKFTGVKPFKHTQNIEDFIFGLVKKYHSDLQLIHLCYLSESFKNFLIKFRGKIIPVLCPRSNLKLKNRLNFKFFIENNIPFALGTDSVASNEDLNVFNEAVFIYESLKNKFENDKFILKLFQSLTYNGYKSLFLKKDFYKSGKMLLIKYEDKKFDIKTLFDGFKKFDKKMIQ